MSLRTLTTSTRLASRLASRRGALLMLGAGLAVWLGVAGVHADEPGFRVIVHPGNPTSSVSRDLLSNLFLKKITRWDDGEAVRPVDQHASSGVRERFSSGVLKRSIASVRNYWQQRIFSGRGVPPPALDSDQAVVSFVHKERGAVGYVSGAARLDGVKVLALK